MGQLPAERIRPSRPFQTSGVDYAAPPYDTWTGSQGDKRVYLPVRLSGVQGGSLRGCFGPYI